MQLIKSVAATALLIAAAVEAKVSFTSFPTDVQVGKPVELTWIDAEGPVTITLKKGKSTDLQTVNVLTGNGADGKYQWTPAGDLAPGDDYALQISSGGEVNYSNQFPIKGGKGPSKLVAETSTVPVVEASTPAAQTTSVAAPSIVPTVKASGVAAPTGQAAASGAVAPSGTGATGNTGPKPTNGNIPPISNISFKNAASPLALIAGIAAAFALH